MTKTSERPIRQSSVVAALDVVGDHWMLLLLRELFLGTTSWTDLSRSLGVSPSTLSTRIGQLVDGGCLEKQPVGGRSIRYALTPRGEDLFPFMIASEEWQAKWEDHAEPFVPGWRHSCGAPLRVDSLCAACDRPVRIADVAVQGGDNAAAEPGRIPHRHFRNNRAKVDDWAEGEAGSRFLQVMGDRRAVTLFAALYMGMHRFDEIERWTGLHPATISDRLRKLQLLGQVHTRLYQERPDRYLYSLSSSGRDMFAVTLQMLQWGDRWIFGEGREPSRLVHVPCGEHLRSVVKCRACHEPVVFADVSAL